ncbi:hypothetical protein [Microcoleus sp. FACHB-1515]|uniref:hypothetical protein n=1 Tax=Cyanophyceae TaxID=3028117 RepID=UPI001F559FC3|nr:hypothetical protein [Microcoleus sp. FACHB-1515]
MTETRNRKPMRSNPLASWELRIANLRVYYDVVEEVDPPLQIVRIRAISVKERNKIFIGGEEVDL